MQRKSGEYVVSNSTGEDVKTFVPYPLPPKDPPLKLREDSDELLQQASQNLARLNLAGDMIPSLDWFVYAFVRKEAVLSSQIEGTQATLTERYGSALGVVVGFVTEHWIVSVFSFIGTIGGLAALVFF